MLISSPRHRKSDLDLWAEHEECDLIHARRIGPKVERSLEAIKQFLSLGHAYCGVSWGKDSVVVAHLCWLVDRSTPLIHLRPTNHNPDCDAVRDDYLRRFGGQPYREQVVDYGDIHARCLPADEQDRLTDEAWYRAINACPEGRRRILGIRADESAGRRVRCLHWGESSPNGCAPLAWWTTADVFAYLAANGLPVHPAYAMLGGGRWPRDRLRVAEIGDVRGGGSGRRDWEMEYYDEEANQLVRRSR